MGRTLRAINGDAMRIFQTAVAISIFLACAQVAFAQDRHALVIGINDYDQVAPLERAVNDARAMASSLAASGFTVDEGYDLGRSDFVQLLSRFINRLDPEDEALIFYAGHAVAIGNENFIVPADVTAIDASNETLIMNESLSQTAVLQQITDTGVRLAVVIMDACRDNPFAGVNTRSTGRSRGLAVEEPPRGIFMLFSADEGQRALDSLGPGDPHPNSVFTRTLIPLIEEEGLDIVDVARRLRGDVQELAGSVGREQFPVYRDRMRGDGRFVVRRGASETPDASPVPVADADPTQGFGRLLVSPQNVSVGDELTVSADAPSSCVPFFFNLASDGEFTPIPLDYFEQTAVAPGQTRYVIDENSQYGLVITPEDAPGANTFGFLCPSAELQTDDIRTVLRAFRDGELALGGGAMDVNAVYVIYNFTQFDVLPQ